MRSPLFIVTLAQPEWDVAVCEDLASQLAQTYDHPNVVVDMSAVTYIDSTCLGKLVGMRRERAQRNFPLERLIVPSAQIRHLFDIVNFDEVWPLYDTLEAARAETDGFPVSMIADA